MAPQCTDFHEISRSLNNLFWKSEPNCIQILQKMWEVRAKFHLRTEV
jgi:hypothetical protein